MSPVGIHPTAHLWSSDVPVCTAESELPFRCSRMSRIHRYFVGSDLLSFEMAATTNVPEGDATRSAGFIMGLQPMRKSIPTVVILFIYCDRTSAMRVKTPSAGFCTFSALLESECSLFSKTNPNRRLEPPPFSDLPAATCARNAVPNTLSGRLAARSRAAVAASIRPIIYSIPTSAMRVKAPSAGFCTFSALLESECSLFSSPKTKPNRRLEPPPFSDLPAATCATNAVPDTLSGRLAARSRAAVAASNRPISILFQRQRCGGADPPRGCVPTTAWFGASFISMLRRPPSRSRPIALFL
jgi:hypothetical protein